MYDRILYYREDLVRGWAQHKTACSSACPATGDFITVPSTGNMKSENNIVIVHLQKLETSRDIYLTSTSRTNVTVSSGVDIILLTVSDHSMLKLYSKAI